MIREMNGWTGGEGEERDSSLCNFLNRAESSFSPLSSRGDTIDRDSGAPLDLAIRGERRTDIAFPLVPRAHAAGTRARPLVLGHLAGARVRVVRDVSRLIRSITYKQFPLMGKDRILPLLYESD